MGLVLKVWPVIGGQTFSAEGGTRPVAGEQGEGGTRRVAGERKVEVW